MWAPQFTTFVSSGTSLTVSSFVTGGRHGGSVLVGTDDLEGLLWCQALILREMQAGWPG